MSSNSETSLPVGTRLPRATLAARHDMFFAHLAETCNVKASYLAARLDKNSLYQRRSRDAGFAARWAEAVDEGYRRIEAGLMQRALGDEADGGALASATAAPFDPELALKLLALKSRMDGHGRRSGVRLKQPDVADALAALDRKLTAMERSLQRPAARRKRRATSSSQGSVER